MRDISKLKSDLQLEADLLDEIEAILREMGSHETIYEFAQREPAKAHRLIRWLLQSIEDDSSQEAAEFRKH